MKKASDLKPGDFVRDEHGKKRRIKEILPSWYNGYIHLIWGKDRTNDLVQVKKSLPVVLIDGAYEDATGR